MVRFSFEKGAPHSPVHIVWGPIALLVIIAARVFSIYLPLAPPCIFRSITGIPCLTCGGTHCVIALSQLDPISAFFYNPMIMLTFMGMIIFSLGWALAIIFQRRLVVKVSSTEKRFLRIMAIFLVAVNWTYLIIRMT